jgi:hypothetical protein
MARRFGSAIVANTDSILRIYLYEYISVNSNNTRRIINERKSLRKLTDRYGSQAPIRQLPRSRQLRSRPKATISPASSASWV